MFSSKHHVSVWPGSGNRGYQYRCSCGATGYVTGSRRSAQQMGDQHKANARKRGR